MAGSTIQMLAALRSRTLDRQEAIELVSNAVDEQENNWASRSWSRQCDGLADAILAEAPTDLSDALSVLLVAMERFDADVIMEDDVRVQSRGERACFQIRIVLANCAAVLADHVSVATPMEVETANLCRRLREHWLPPVASAAGRAIAS